MITNNKKEDSLPLPTRTLRVNPEIQLKIHEMTERFRAAARAGAKSNIRVGRTRPRG